MLRTQEVYEKSLINKTHLQILKDMKERELERMYLINESIERSLQDKVSMQVLQLQKMYYTDKQIMEKKIAMLNDLIEIWDTEQIKWDDLTTLKFSIELKEENSGKEK